VEKPVPLQPDPTPIKTQPVASVKPTGLNEWLFLLRNCESGGDYTKNTGNGYFGAYQFSQETWARVSPKLGRPDLANILPHQASPADQDFMVIGNANISAGLVSQHPGCYKKLGLSNKPPQE